MNDDGSGKEKEAAPQVAQETIPTAVRRALRREVGFGCPVKGCGSPYLSYHHFDPPMRDNPSEHNPDGMIALCLPHHKKADAGNWTAEQLRAMKAHPLHGGGPVPARFDLFRRDMLVVLGTNICVIRKKARVLLNAGGRNLVWVDTTEEGFKALSLQLFDEEGKPFLEMDRNDWTVLGDVDDIEAKPCGLSLWVNAPARGTLLSLQFASLDEEKARAWLDKHEARGRTDALPRNRRIREILAAYPPRAASRGSSLYETVASQITEWPITRVQVEAKIRFPRVLSMRSNIQIPGIMFSHCLLGGDGAGVCI